jgi:hypothetical protein
MKRNNNRNNNKKNKNRVPYSPYSLALQSMYSNSENTRITGFDPHKYMTLKYTTLITNSLPTGTGAQQTMNLNSIFDPDRTGAGHQPLYFDQVAAIYNRYRVLKARWKITFAPATNPVYALVVPVNGLLSTAITTAATFETACENPRSRFSTVGTSVPYKISGAIALNNLNGCAITEYLADDRFEAVVTTSPSEVITLVIGLYNPNGVTVAINQSIEIIYCVDLHDPISVAGS